MKKIKKRVLLLIYLLFIPQCVSCSWSWWENIIKAPIQSIAQSIDPETAKKLFPIAIVASLVAFYYWMNKKQDGPVSNKPKNKDINKPKLHIQKKVHDIDTIYIVNTGDTDFDQQIRTKVGDLVGKKNVAYYDPLDMEQTNEIIYQVHPGVEYLEKNYNKSQLNQVGALLKAVSLAIKHPNGLIFTAANTFYDVGKNPTAWWSFGQILASNHGHMYSGIGAMIEYAKALNKNIHIYDENAYVISYEDFSDQSKALGYQKVVYNPEYEKGALQFLPQQERQFLLNPDGLSPLTNKEVENEQHNRPNDIWVLCYNLKIPNDKPYGFKESKNYDYVYNKTGYTAKTSIPELMNTNGEAVRNVSGSSALFNRGYSASRRAQYWANIFVFPKDQLKPEVAAQVIALLIQGYSHNITNPGAVQTISVPKRADIK
jgi:hypothetical protein